MKFLYLHILLYFITIGKGYDSPNSGYNHQDEDLMRPVALVTRPCVGGKLSV